MLKESFIKIIKEDRLSVRKISELAGISNTTLSNWVYGLSNPPADGIEKVLNALGYEIAIINKEQIKWKKTNFTKN